MAVKSHTSSPLREKYMMLVTSPSKLPGLGSEAEPPIAIMERVLEKTPKTKITSPRSCRSSSYSPVRDTERMSRLRRARPELTTDYSWPTRLLAPSITCTPTPTPASTPGLHSSPEPTLGRALTCGTKTTTSHSSGSSIGAVVAGGSTTGRVVDESLAPAATSRRSMFPGVGFATGSECLRSKGEFNAGKRQDRKKQETQVGEAHVSTPRGRPHHTETQGPRMAISIETEVDMMLDEDEGTLRLRRGALGDERVPNLSLPQLREAYRTGTGRLRSWTTAGLVGTGTGGGTPHPAHPAASLIEVEESRLGVLSSRHAYLFLFEAKLLPAGLRRVSSNANKTAHEKRGLLGGPTPPEAEDDDKGKVRDLREELQGLESAVEVSLVYLWLGREADAVARTVARTQGRRLIKQHPLSTSSALMEIEQGCEPALFLALFSYMEPPLSAVILQGREESPDLRVLELQESPCLPGADIAFAVEGDASLLAKHGPLPRRSYVILVRPRRRRACGSRNRERGGENSSSDGSTTASSGRASVGLATFDAGYNWHGRDESPAVEQVGILLCQQVERMFPPPHGSIPDYCAKRKASAPRRRKWAGGTAGGFGMMRGFVTDVKAGSFAPEGFWACIFPEQSSRDSGEMHQALKAQQESRPRPRLRPRARPVRMFGVCTESRKAGQRFVREVTAGCMPSQMRLSPSLSYVIDAGGSVVYVWHGVGSEIEGRRLACRVAQAYTKRLEALAIVEQADAGSEPPDLLDCFVGWDQTLVEPPTMLSYSPQRQSQAAFGPTGISPASSLSPPTTTTWAGAKSATEAPSSSVVVPGGAEHVRGRRRVLERGRRRSTTSRGSSSSASRLTPPGQRTPSTMTVNSPPRVRSLPGGISPTRGSTGSGTGDVMARFQAFSTQAMDYAAPGSRCPDLKSGSVGGGLSPPRQAVVSTRRSSIPLCFDPLDTFEPVAPTVDCSCINEDDKHGTYIREVPGDFGTENSSDLPRDDWNSFPSSGIRKQSAEDVERDRVKSGIVSGGWIDTREAGEYGYGETGAHRAPGYSVMDVMDKVLCEEYPDQRLVSHADERLATTEVGNERGGKDAGHGQRIRVAGSDQKLGASDQIGYTSRCTDGDDDALGNTGRFEATDVVGNEDRDCEYVIQNGDGATDEGDNDHEESDSCFRMSGVELFQGGEIGSGPISGMNLGGRFSSVENDTKAGMGHGPAALRRPSVFFRSPQSLDSLPPNGNPLMKPLADVDVVPRIGNAKKRYSSNGGRSRRGSNGIEDGNGVRAERSASQEGEVMFNNTDHRSVTPGSDAGVLVAGSGGRPPRRLIDSIDFAPALGKNQARILSKTFLDAQHAVPSRAMPPRPTALTSNSNTESHAAPVAALPRGSGKGDASVDHGSEEEWLSQAGADQDSDNLSSRRSVESHVSFGSRLGYRKTGCFGEASVDLGGETWGAGESEDVRGWRDLREGELGKDDDDGCATGAFGGLEGDRRRLPNIKRDESWRAEGVRHEDQGGMKDIRRESASFTRLVDGNVRSKLTMFEGSDGSSICGSSNEREIHKGDRSSLGVLQELGLVRAMSQTIEHRSPSSIFVVRASNLAEEDGDGGRGTAQASFTCSKSMGKTGTRSPELNVDSKRAKEGPSRSPPSRPSLELIRDGRVRSMSKQLSFSCTEFFAPQNELERQSTRSPSKSKPLSGLLGVCPGMSKITPLTSEKPSVAHVEATGNSPSRLKSLWGGVRRRLNAEKRVIAPASAPVSPIRSACPWWEGDSFTPPSNFNFSGAEIEKGKGKQEARQEFCKEKTMSGRSLGVWKKLRRRWADEKRSRGARQAGDV